ncbi:hypothetical protein C5167_036170 [Papaver somniferum]|nr:hypothetical protein C5167_036170 [Papaver somniferum]
MGSLNQTSPSSQNLIISVDLLNPSESINFLVYGVYASLLLGLFGFRQLSWTAKSNTLQEKGCTFLADSKIDPTTQHNENPIKVIWYMKLSIEVAKSSSTCSGPSQMIRFGAHLVLVLLRYVLAGEMRDTCRQKLKSVGDIILQM